jgi:UDP-3-O-[3-hydroxymyristoyl] N-acetylglucosamine deacetylase
MHLQRTIKKDISCINTGLHSGRKVNMTIRPAGVNEGIVFIRKDLSNGHRIKADYNSVCDTTLATTIGSNGSAVSTVEHLMSALFGMGVDNAIIEVDGPEIPIMDGSARPFVDLLKDVGTRTQGEYKKLLVVTKTTTVTDGEGHATLSPYAEYRISYRIGFKHPLIGEQSYDMIFSDENYENEICAARTFGFLKDVEYLQAKGLALGGSLKNAIVLDDSRILNKEGLRCSCEFVKHKILDAIGDLSLLGMPIIGHFTAYKSGHRLNNMLLKELMSHKENWIIVSQSSEELNNSILPLKLPSFHILDAVSA